MTRSRPVTRRATAGRRLHLQGASRPALRPAADRLGRAAWAQVLASVVAVRSAGVKAVRLPSVANANRARTTAAAPRPSVTRQLASAGPAPAMTNVKRRSRDPSASAAAHLQAAAL